MRELYEGYIGVLSVDHGPNFKYGPAPAPPDLSYRKPLPGYPAGGNIYQQGLTRPDITDVIDEEDQAISKAITLKKVDKLIEQSVTDGMDYATIQLAKLRESIKHQKVLGKRN